MRKGPCYTGLLLLLLFYFSVKPVYCHLQTSLVCDRFGGKGAVLLSQIELLCPEPKALAPKWEVLASRLGCTINTVPQFPHVQTEQRE